MRQAARLPVPNTQAHGAAQNEISHSSRLSRNNTVQNLISYRFRADRALLSLSRISAGLQLGHSTLSLLTAASSGSTTARASLASLLRSTASHSAELQAFRHATAGYRAPMSPKKAAKVEHIRTQATKANFRAQPGVKKISERPLPSEELKGEKRRVPFLVTAMGRPFLRYGGPQSTFLTNMLRNKAVKMSKLWGCKTSLAEVHRFAELEDEWDGLIEYLIISEGLAKKQRKELMIGRNIMWTDAIQDVDMYLWRKISEDNRKNTEQGKRLFEIMTGERELAGREKGEATAKRRQQRKMELAEQALKEAEQEAAELLAASGKA